MVRRLFTEWVSLLQKLTARLFHNLPIVFHNLNLQSTKHHKIKTQLTEEIHSQAINRVLYVYL